MTRLLPVLILLTSMNSLACRAPVNIDSSVISFDYLDTRGEYSITIPAQIGDSELGSVGLYFMKVGSTIYSGKHEFGRELDLIRQGPLLIGEFSAFSKEGYEAYISARWQARPCPAVSDKKIKLFPKNS